MTKPDIVIRNGSVIDGTGAPARNADVAITDGVISQIADKIDDIGTTSMLRSHGIPSRRQAVGMASPAPCWATAE